VEYPIGHRRRREEGIPMLLNKCENNLGTVFNEQQIQKQMALFLDQEQLEKTPVNEFMDMFIC
jgi:2-methylcitrate dehydratase